jgi:2-polyprenyl-6-methoxyphenol hydroxylase-like FAD-dependent oxidoreductase
MTGSGGGPGKTISTTCCVAGGGPAGVMLGLLLARAGVDVVVLEKHADFLRDFRGDTIHPSTLTVMEELGLLDELLKRPHNDVRRLQVMVGETSLTVANFSFLPQHRAFIAMMPQWHFLDFLAEHARRYPNFQIFMQADVTDDIEEGGRVAGVRATTPDGPLEVKADLVVGADGRHSTVREKAGLEIEDIGAPIDVFWMRISRVPGDPGSGGRIDAGSFFAMLDRGDYWQLAYVIPKGESEPIRAAGLPAFREIVAKALPFLAERVGELKTWDDVKLLTVRIDRLRKWYRPGLLCIGDAAHAMSPIGGVGINLAVQDAVATANLLWKPLKEGAVTEDDLAGVQKRREFPMRVTQRFQVLAQKRVIQPVLSSTAPTLSPPWALRLMNKIPLLQQIPARFIGIGVRPEHVQSPAAAPQAARD